jgi:hypothetical protein
MEMSRNGKNIVGVGKKPAGKKQPINQREPASCSVGATLRKPEAGDPPGPGKTRFTNKAKMATTTTETNTNDNRLVLADLDRQTESIKFVDETFLEVRSAVSTGTGSSSNFLLFVRCCPPSSVRNFRTRPIPPQLGHLTVTSERFSKELSSIFILLWQWEHTAIITNQLHSSWEKVNLGKTSRNIR